LEVDFGEYLGVQLVSVDAYEPWVPPPVSTHEAAAIEEVIHLARSETFVIVDIVGIPAYHVLQRDVPSQQPRQPFRSLEFEDADRMGTMSGNVDQPASATVDKDDFDPD
jgi:hypothetical protein